MLLAFCVHAAKQAAVITMCNNIMYSLSWTPLEASGIEDQFNRMKAAIGKLPRLFCKQVRFALITFSSYVNLEFCFNCFDNTAVGRGAVKSAIESVAYRGGSSYTGGTVQCVCEELLSSQCGSSRSPDCLDVVFITDGKSNDPNLEVCDEVHCLHNRLAVNTYAIGISSGAGFSRTYDVNELNCITEFSDLFSAFQYESFDDFEQSIEHIQLLLLQVLPNSPQSCFTRAGHLSPTGAQS